MRYSHELEIEGTPETLFALTQDYARRLEWDPFLSQARLLRGATVPEVGVRALCTDRKGNAMEVAYVAFDPPNAAAVKMTRGPLFFASFAGTWRFAPVDGARTRVRFKYFYRLRWPFGFFAERIAAEFARETTARLEALREFAEHPKR